MRYGPDAQPARNIPKDLITSSSYERVWKGDAGTLWMPTVQAVARMDTMFLIPNAMREVASDARTTTSDCRCRCS